MGRDTKSGGFEHEDKIFAARRTRITPSARRTRVFSGPLEARVLKPGLRNCASAFATARRDRQGAVGFRAVTSGAFEQRMMNRCVHT